MGMKVLKDISDNLALLFLGSRTHSASNCIRSAHSELCEHYYLARSQGGPLARSEGGR